MAKKTRYQRKYSYVAGKSTRQLLDIDLKEFLTLTQDQLKQVVSRLAATANKRLKEFEKRGESSPAYTKAMKSGGKFKVGGKNLNELRKEYLRAKDYLTSKTGTRQQFKDIVDRTINTLQHQGIDLDRQQFGKFWQTYNDLKRYDASISNRNMKYRVLREIRDVVVKNPNMSLEERTEQMRRKLVSIYEESVQDESGKTWSEEFLDLFGLHNYI